MEDEVPGYHMVSGVMRWGRLLIHSGTFFEIWISVGLLQRASMKIIVLSGIHEFLGHVF